MFHHHRQQPKQWYWYPLRGILFLGLFFAFTVLFMYLWNWVMPAVFGLKAIEYTQALGILVISKILFGGFGGGHRGCHSHRHHHCRCHQRDEQTSPEQE